MLRRRACILCGTIPGHIQHIITDTLLFCGPKCSEGGSPSRRDMSIVHDKHMRWDMSLWLHYLKQ